MQVHKALAQGLIDHGVTTLFGLMGDGNLYLANYYSSIPGATYIASAHEAGAVLMANGYASVSGEVGVATVTHGP
ncbi:thiamine pyrophosphate-binding protein [Rhodococcus sp. T2V]